LQAEGVNVGEEVDLGSCLVAFFHRFGGSLDTCKFALSIERGGIVRKRGALLNRAKPWRLAIEDPQEPNKDIGGAIFNIDAVKRTFGNASVKLNSATPNDGEQALDLWAEVQAESTHMSVEPYSNMGRRVMPMLNNIMSTEAALTRRRVGAGKGRGKRKKEKENKKQKFGTMEQEIMRQQKAEKKKEMAKKGKKGANAKSGKKTQTEGDECANKKKEAGKKSQSKGAITERSGNKRKEAGKRKRLMLGVGREQKARRVMETKS
jgi:non-canonical poly(A) RNA polymerase PAPD5/7